MTQLGRLEEQAIAATRFGVRGLIVVCVATIALVASSQRNIDQEAVAELNALIDLDLRTIMVDAALRDPRVAEQVDAITAFLNEYGLALNVYEPNSNFLEVNVEPAQAPLLIVERSPLETIYARFTQTTELAVSIVDFASIEETLRVGLTRFRDDIESTEIALAVGDNDSNFSIRWYKQRGSNTLSVEPQGTVMRRSFFIPFDLMMLLYAQPRYSSMFANQENGLSFLPNTREVWDQVRSENPTAARNLLARQSEVSERNMQIFGLSIPESLVSWATPTFLFVLSFYLAVYVSHLRRLVSTDPQIGRYPWYPFMRDKRARYLTGTTIVGLPAFALAVTNYATWGSAWWPIQIGSVAVSLFAIGFLVWCYRSMPKEPA